MKVVKSFCPLVLTKYIFVKLISFCRRRSLVNIRTQVKEIMFNAIALFLSRTAVRTKENNKVELRLHNIEIAIYDGRGA